MGRRRVRGGGIRVLAGGGVGAVALVVGFDVRVGGDGEDWWGGGGERERGERGRRGVKLWGMKK